MNEWELIVERLQAAVRAEEMTREAARASANRENNEPFKARVAVLSNRLEWLQNVLAHVDQYALEELVDAFLTPSGKSAHYHRFVHNNGNEKK